MKNTMLKCWFLLVLLMLAACQEKEELNHVAKGSVSLKASIENSDARTSVDEEGHVSWVVADAIGVFGEETENARFQSISSGSEVLFIGDMSSHQDVPFLAYYPYDENASLDGNALHFTLPSSYTYTGQSQAPMLGVKQANGNFVFKHLCGLLKVKVKNMPENAKRLFVVSEGTEDKEAPAITGDVLVNDVTAIGAVLELVGNGEKKITIDVSTTTTTTDSLIFYIPLPIGNYPKIIVKLETEDGIISFEKSVSNVNIKRAFMLDMTVIDVEEEKPYLGENMVLGENTVLLTESFTKYVSSVITDNVIVLDASFPEEKLPEVSDILFYGDASKTFPNGLLNRVIQIEKSDVGYKLVTEPAALQDAFDKLYINQESIIEFKDDNFSRGLTDILPNFPFPFHRLPYYDNEGFVGYQHIWGFKLGSGYELTSDNEKVNWSFSGNGEFSLDANIYFATKLRTHIEINKELDKSFISLLFDFKAGGSFSEISNANYSGNLEIQLLELEFNPLPLTPQGAAVKILANPKFGVNLFLDLNAEMELEWENAFEKKYQIAYLYNKGEITEWEAKEIKGTGDKEDLNTPALNLGGSITVGVSAGFELEIACGTLSAELPISLGIKGQKDSFINADENGNYSYELLKDEKLERSVELTTELTFKTPFLKSKGNNNNGYEVDKNKFTSLTLPLLNLNFPWDTLYYVPEFRELSSYDYGDKYSVLYEVDRDLIWPTELNIALKNDEDIVLKESTNKLTYWSWLITGENTIASEFTELDPKKSYSICPVVTTPIFGKMYADPMIERKAFKIYTKNYQINVFYNSIVCYGQLENIENKVYISEYGICYNKQSEPTEKHFVPSKNLTDNLTFSSSLDYLENGIYEYRAYIKVGEEYYYADETKTFEVEPEEEEKITIGEPTNITQTAVTLSGNIQGYEADDFQHRYGIIYSADTTPTASNGTVVYSNNIQEDGNYSVDVASLTQNTTYYYRAFVIDGGNYVYGDVKSFITLDNVNSLRDALIYLYNTTGGDNWLNNENWCSDKPLTEWYGISINQWHEKLIIDLRENNLTGFVDFKAETTEESKIFSNVLSLYFDENNLTSIDISGIQGVSSLNCAGNPLKSILAVNCPDLSYFGCDERNYEQSFKVDKKIDLSNSTKLSTINCSGSNVVELSIKGCSSLETLMCSKNKLTTIDFTGCDAIYDLNLDYNSLVTVDFSEKKSIWQLSIRNNKLEHINVNGCTSLSFICASSNYLKSISLNGLNPLETAQFSDNQLNEVNITNCPSLIDLDFNNNELQKIDVCGLPSLASIIFENNEVRDLNIEGCENLRFINANRNKLTALNLSGYTKLERLYCNYNNLTELNLDECFSLKVLRCYGNKLTEMNVEHCTLLEELECTNNNIRKEITEFFMNLKYFYYDIRYYYSKQDDGSIKVRERSVGWWYQGEPDRGYHKK